MVNCALQRTEVKRPANTSESDGRVLPPTGFTPKVVMLSRGEHLRGHYYPAPLTRRELAEFLDVSLRTVDGYVRQRRIPYIRLGRLIRFRIEDVERALQRFTVKEVQL